MKKALFLWSCLLLLMSFKQPIREERVSVG